MSKLSVEPLAQLTPLLQVVTRCGRTGVGERSLHQKDVLAGVVSYANRNLDTSPAKQALVQRVRECSRYTLLKTTLLREEKFNIFRWQPEPKAH